MNDQFIRQAKLPRGAYIPKPFGEVVKKYMNETTKMNWKNLRQNICPKCNNDFMQGLQSYPEVRAEYRGMGQVLSHPCGFKIHEQRYSQIVTGMVTRDLDERFAE